MSVITSKKSVFDTASLTDTGSVRENNEDSLLALDTREDAGAGWETCGIYLVADGMGGHQAGEVASGMATRIIPEALLEGLKRARKPVSPNLLIKQAIRQANREIYQAAQDEPSLFTMGTTVTLGLRLDNRLYIGHVGDSRAYLMRKGRLRQLTQDHSLVAHLIREGIITAEEAKTHTERNKILRCLGVTPETEIDSYRQAGGKDWLALKSGDSLLFCSDGLSGYVPDEEIRDCLRKGREAGETCRELVRLANLKGGEDNISVIVVRVIPSSGKKRPPEKTPEPSATRRRR